MSFVKGQRVMIVDNELPSDPPNPLDDCTGFFGHVIRAVSHPAKDLYYVLVSGALPSASLYDQRDSVIDGLNGDGIGFPFYASELEAAD